jgi:signal peptidase I
MAAPRKPWLAGVLSLVVPGLGQLYGGCALRAAVAFVFVAPVEFAIYLLAVVLPFGVANLLIPLALIVGVRAAVAYDAVRVAREAVAPLPWFSRWYFCALAVVAGAGINVVWTSAYRNSFVQAYKIPTGTMQPAILVGDHLLAVKWAYGWREPFAGHVIAGSERPRRGELVVFRFPEDPSRPFLKRVIGLPGETVEIRRRVVLIDGVPVDEPYAHFISTIEAGSLGDDWGPQTVPPESYFVLGDNRDNSRDSRYWGFLPQELLLG